MYLGPAILFSIFAGLFYVPGFLDLPLGLLTARQFISQLLFSVSHISSPHTAGSVHGLREVGPKTPL